jgi:hypothetical protein
MDQRLRRALDLVLVDAIRSGVPVPELADEDWSDDPLMATALMNDPEGGSEGVRAMLDVDEAGRVLEVADQVQEWVIHKLWPDQQTNWPACPEHPDSHPLLAATVQGVATWVCPSRGTPFAAIGALHREPRDPLPCAEGATGTP